MNRHKSTEEWEIERAMGSSLERVVKRLVIALISVAALMAGGYLFFLVALQPPPVTNYPIVYVPVETPAPRPMAERVEEPPPVVEEPIEEGWRHGVYTILIAGEDDDFGGTDVVMVALFDTRAGTLDVLSIPRDTLVNVPWNTRRINTFQNLYTRLDQDFPHYIYALRDGVSKLIGHETTNWITLDLDGFVNLVDAIGGVEFDVPQRMRYSDPYQGLFINLQPGLQRLDGEQAMHLVRFRSYREGDIQRIRTQQAFLGALAEQLLQARNLWVIDDIIQIFRDNVDTDLSLMNLGYFAREFLLLDSENINFHTVDRDIANIFDRIHGASYVTLYVEPWLELINAYMNPFTFEITADDVEIVSRDENGNLFVTNGTLYGGGNWGRR